MISTRRRSARLALAAARKAVVRQRGAPPLRRQRITRLSSGVPRRDIGAAPSAAQVARPDGQARALPCGGELVAGVPAPVGSPVRARAAGPLRAGEQAPPRHGTGGAGSPPLGDDGAVRGRRGREKERASEFCFFRFALSHSLRSLSLFSL